MTRTRGMGRRRMWVLVAARFAGYHGNQQKFTRLLVEERVAKKALDAAWDEGRRARLAGVPCTCEACRGPA